MCHTTGSAIWQRLAELTRRSLAWIITYAAEYRINTGPPASAGKTSKKASCPNILFPYTIPFFLLPPAIAASPFLSTYFNWRIGCPLYSLSLVFFFFFNSPSFSPCSGLSCRGLHRGLPSALLALSLSLLTSSLLLPSPSSRNVATPPSLVCGRAFPLR